MMRKPHVPGMIGLLAHLLLSIVAVGEDRVEHQVRILAAPFIDAGRVQSMTIGVIKGDKRYTFAFGRLSPMDERKPDDATLYEIGSVSKTFTALLLAEEVVHERLTLDTPVAELLPKDVKVPAGKTRGVTLADLATHHSGLLRMPSNWSPADKLDPYADYTMEKMYAFLGETKLLWEPGEKYLYSNVASALLGQALALRLGQEYDAIVAARIYKPLGMNDTATVLSQDQRKRFAPPRTADGDEAKAWNLGVFNPAGGIRSNVVDMLNYVEAQLGKRKSDLDGAITLSHMRHHDIEGGGGMALGWHIAPDRESYWHNGQTGGYHSFVLFNRTRDIGVVILGNTATYEIDQLGNQITRMLAGADVKPATFDKEIKVDRKVLQRYVGVYRMTPQFALTVTLRRGVLYVQATGQDPYAIYPESDTRFNYRVVDAAITFEADDKGAWNKLTLHQNGRDMPAVRVTTEPRP